MHCSALAPIYRCCLKISASGFVPDFALPFSKRFAPKDFDLPPNSRLLAVLPVADGIEPELSDTFSKKMSIRGSAPKELIQWSHVLYDIQILGFLEMGDPQNHGFQY